MQNKQKRFSKLIISSILLSSLVGFEAKAEETSSVIPPIKIEGYIDSYYAYDTDPLVMPKGQDKRKENSRALNAIGYRKNEVNLNTAQLTASTTTDLYRARMTVAYGTMPQQLWFPTEYLSLQEANLGFRLIENLWFDGGIFLTHIGGEALLPKNNWLSSLAMTTMFEPFYQGGAKLTYKPTEQVEVQLHALNGYGLIEAVNPMPAAGLLVTYTPMSNLAITYSGYAGNPKASTDPAAFRSFNDLNFSYQITENVGLRGSIDVAYQSDIASLYHSGFLTARYNFNPSWSVSARGEYVYDEKGMLSAYPNLKDAGIMGGGVTLGGEFKPTDTSYVRLEGRQLFFDANKNKIFQDLSRNPSSSRFELMGSVGLWF